MPLSRPAISLALRLSTPLSSPKSRTMICARVPATSSSIRHWIGWLKLATMPGTSSMASRILSINSSRLLALVHSPRGLSEPTNPVLSTPRASIAMPVCPVRETIVSSSGNCFRRRSTSADAAIAVSSDTPGSIWRSMSKAPSSITGRNSVPSRGTATPAATSESAATATTATRWPSAHRRTGR